MAADDILTRQAAINDGLERLQDLGFTMDGGLAEHGPMVAEAICTLGHVSATGSWIDAYRSNHRHERMPAAKRVIDPRIESDWRAALGDESNLTDWLTAFGRELSDFPWLTVIQRWVPVLIDGHAGGLTHGLIRTSHAVRSFPPDGTPSRLQLDELARGLAYWAGTYRVAVGNPDKHGPLTLTEALRDLPRLERSPKGSLNELPGYTDVIESLSRVDSAEAAIGLHTAAFARVLYAHPEIFQIPLVHAITAPTAVQNLLPYFPPEFAIWTYGRLWQVSAALVARFAGTRRSSPESDVAISEPTLPVNELILRAIEHGDEHVIKLTEACLREDNIRPDPVYRALAESMLTRVKPRPRKVS